MDKIAKHWIKYYYYYLMKKEIVKDVRKFKYK